MTALFYVTGGVALLATVLTITRLQAVHALLYLIVSLLAVALLFLMLGASFAAALEVIVYAGAIMVLFVFVVMLLNVAGAREEERRLLSPKAWAGPTLLALLLAVELGLLVRADGQLAEVAVRAVGPRVVGESLFGPYVLGVEIASLLLLAALVGAYHLGKRMPAAGLHLVNVPAAVTSVPPEEEAPAPTAAGLGGAA